MALPEGYKANAAITEVFSENSVLYAFKAWSPFILSANLEVSPSGRIMSLYN